MIAIATKKPKLAIDCHADAISVRKPSARAKEVVMTARPVSWTEARIALAGSTPARRCRL